MLARVRLERVHPDAPAVLRVQRRERLVREPLRERTRRRHPSGAGRRRRPVLASESSLGDDAQARERRGGVRVRVGTLAGTLAGTLGTPLARRVRLALPVEHAARLAERTRRRGGGGGGVLGGERVGGAGDGGVEHRRALRLRQRPSVARLVERRE